MSDYVNRVTLALPRNGTASHTVNASSVTGGGTVVDGTPFTPTNGRLLVAIAEGAVTSGTGTSVPTAPPANWNGPTGNQAVNNSGLYVWYRTATGNSTDDLSMAHNGSNYAMVVTFLEFYAGSTFGTSVAATAVSAGGGAGPTLSGLSTSPKFICFVAGMTNPGTGTTGWTPTTWSVGTKISDSFVSKNPTDGYTFSWAELNQDVATSRSSAATISGTGASVPSERLVFSVNAVLPPSGPTTNAGADQSNLKTYTPVTLNFSSTGATGAVTYNVTQTAGPAVTLSGTGATRIFTVPPTQAPTKFTFSVTATDAANNSTGPADTVDINVLPWGNWRATASGWVPYAALKTLRVSNLDGGSASVTTSDIIDGGTAAVASGTSYSGGSA